MIFATNAETLSVTSISIPGPQYTFFLCGGLADEYGFTSHSWSTDTQSLSGGTVVETGIGSQTANNSCSFSPNTYYDSLAEMALENPSNYNVYTASTNGLSSSKIVLNYTVPAPGAFVAILAMAQNSSSTAITTPAGCTVQQNIGDLSFYNNVYVESCQQSAGSYNVTLTPASPEWASTAAYVFSSSGSRAP